MITVVPVCRTGSGEKVRICSGSSVCFQAALAVQGSNYSEVKRHPEGVCSTMRVHSEPVWMGLNQFDSTLLYCSHFWPFWLSLVRTSLFQLDPVYVCYKELLFTCPTPIPAPSPSPGWLHLIGPPSSIEPIGSSEGPRSLPVGWGEWLLLVVPSVWLASREEEVGLRLMTSSKWFGDSAIRGTTRQQSKSLVRTWLIWKKERVYGYIYG